MSRYDHRIWRSLLIMAFVQMACSVGAPQPTATPMPTNTLLPTETPVPTLTNTPPPTNTPTPEIVTITVAVLGPMSGNIESFGIAEQNGVLLAAEQWNSKPEKSRFEFVPVMIDTECDAIKADKAAQEVVSKGFHYIIGDTCSRASIPIAKVAESNGIVQITPGATNPAVTINPDGITRKYVFRSCFIDSYQGEAMARFTLGENITSAFIAFDSTNNYVTTLARAYEQAFISGGGAIVGKYDYSVDAGNYNNLVAAVLKSKTPVLFVPDYYDVVNEISRKAREKGVTAILMGGDGLESTGLDVDGEHGVYYSSHFGFQNDDPVNKEFLALYKARYDEVPDAVAALSYEAMQILMHAIEKAGVDDPAVVKEILASEVFDVLTGKLVFDASHNPIKSVFVFQVFPEFNAVVKKIPADLP